jgi:hypothetical protein
VNLADRVFAAVQAKDYGVFDGLVTSCSQPSVRRVRHT